MSNAHLRILYLHQYFVPPSTHGGTRSYEFARRLIDAGHEVTVITSSAFLPEPYRSITRTEHTTIAGIPVTVIPIRYSNKMPFHRRLLAFFQFAILASLAAMRQKADVVFATSTPLTIAVPGLLASRWQRIPMVFEVRDLWPELPIAIGALNNPIAVALARLLEWVAYHGATHVVALSPGMAEGVIRRGIPAARVTVLPNSADLDLFGLPREAGQPIRERLGLAPDQPLIVYTGTFGPINQAGYLVELAAAARESCPGMRFLMVGNGMQEDAIRQRAAELSVLDESLHIWGPVPKAEMPALLAAADVCTSLFAPLEPMWNNSANKFFDALAAGRPIAINYGGWQADLLRDTGAGIVLPPDDPQEAAHNLADFVRDTPRVQAAGLAARHLAERRFDRDAMAERLETVLRQAVRG
jgi:glycosyltransferase involved in cell wall biosynthesis